MELKKILSEHGYKMTRPCRIAGGYEDIHKEQPYGFCYIYPNTVFEVGDYEILFPSGYKRIAFAKTTIGTSHAYIYIGDGDKLQLCMISWLGEVRYAKLEKIQNNDKVVRS